MEWSNGSLHVRGVEARFSTYSPLLIWDLQLMIGRLCA